MDRYNRARLLAEQGRYELAMEEAAAYLAKHPNSSRGHTLLSFCQSEKGAHKQAIQQAQQALGLAPDDDFCHFALARAYYYDNNLKEAEAAISIALNLDPDDPDYHAQAAMVFHEQRKFEKALNSAKAGLRLDPNNSTCRNMQVITLLETNSISEAEQIVDQALRLTPESAFAHTAQGWVSLHHGNDETARESFREALRIKPDSKWARQGMMEALKAKNLFYRWVLRYDLWLKGLGGTQRMLLIGVLIFIPPLRGLYLLILIPGIAIKAIASLTLRFDPYGKLLLENDTNQERVPLWIVSIIWMLIAAIGAYFKLISLLILVTILGMGYLGWRCYKSNQNDLRLRFGLATVLLPLWLWVTTSESAMTAPPQEAAAGAIAGIIMWAVVGILLYLTGFIIYRISLSIIRQIN